MTTINGLSHSDDEIYGRGATQVRSGGHQWYQQIDSNYKWIAAGIVSLYLMPWLTIFIAGVSYGCYKIFESTANEWACLSPQEQKEVALEVRKMQREFEVEYEDKRDELSGRNTVARSVRKAYRHTKKNFRNTKDQLNSSL